MSAASDNTNANPDNILFTIKDTKLYVHVVNSSAKDNKNLSDILSKEFEISVYLNAYKTEKIEYKMRQMNLDINSNQILWESVDYLF